MAIAEAVSTCNSPASVRPRHPPPVGVLLCGMPPADSAEAAGESERLAADRTRQPPS